MFNTSILKKLGPLFSLLLFTLALFVLHREMARFHLSDILTEFHQLPTLKFLSAVFVTLICYLIMSGYDYLALSLINRPLAYPRIMLASFVGYAFSNNIGLSMIAGASVRYRLYSAWGLSGIEITKVILFCSATLWLGFFLLGGTVFIINPLALPPVFHFPLHTARPIGILMISAVILYAAYSLQSRPMIRIRHLEIFHLSPRLLFYQVLISSLDWLLAAAVLYLLLPDAKGLTFSHCLAAYLLAQLAGLISQVPGGLGIFESIIILQLNTIIPGAKLMGSLLAFRFVYYLLPFSVAISLLGYKELVFKKKWPGKITFLFDHWVTSVMPSIMSLAVFIAGAVLLFSGATPAIDIRLEWLKNHIPLIFIEISHFTGSIAGVGLLILARGLQRRLNTAFFVTALFLIVGITASLVKGLDYEEATILAIVLISLLAARKEFYRKVSFWSQGLSFSWIATIFMILISSVALGMFAYKHVEYSNQMWWQFTFSGDAPRFLRATMGIVGVVLILGITRIFRPGAPEVPLPNPADIHTAEKIVRQSNSTVSNLAFLGDKSFLFNPERTAFIMFGIQGRSWVSMGNPVGPEDEWPELIWQFRELGDQYDGWTVFYEVPGESVHHYLELGLTVTKLGEEARVYLPDFSLEGRHHKELRYVHHKLEKEGYLFEVVPEERVPAILPELQQISDAWLTEKNAREKSFSLGCFLPDYISRFSVAVAKKNEHIIAFANIWQSSGQDEISIDLMRYHPERAPKGIMDFMFTELILWSRHQNFAWFNMGMAPLTGLEEHFLAPLWNRLAAFIAHHGEQFYNFQGLRKYKDKYGPVWQPKYLISPGGIVLPKILLNLLSLISGTLKGAVSK